MSSDAGYNVSGNATGVWTCTNYGETPIYNSGKKGEVSVSDADKKILCSLADRIANLASLDIQKSKIKLWKDHNALRTKQPVIFCDPENGWNDIVTADMLKCSGSLARRWEVVLIKELFWGEELKDDKPIESIFDIGYTYTENDWAGEDSLVKGGKGGGSYIWEAPIKSLKDLSKMKMPHIEIDFKTTQQTVDLAGEVFGGLLKVNLKGRWWQTFGFTYDIARLLGLNEMFMYFYDNPELIQQTMSILKQGYEKKIEFIEQNNLLSLNNDRSYFGSGGLGYSDELPSKDFNAKNVRLIDMWGFAESQETSSVSPEMFEKFVFKYQLPILKRFGLTYYGCCEPLNKRWDIIKNIPNLRKVSVSHWADKEKMVEQLQDKYIYALKPTPADLAVPEVNKDYVRENIKKYLDITKGCVLEIVMKDNHTLGRNPNNLINWVKIVREEINKIYG